MYNGTFTYYPFWILLGFLLGIVFFPIIIVVIFSVTFGIENYALISIIAEVAYLCFGFFLYSDITKKTPNLNDQLDEVQRKYIETFVSSNEKYERYTIGDTFLIDYKVRDDINNITYVTEVTKANIYKYALEKNKSFYDLVTEKDEGFFNLLKKNGAYVQNNEYDFLKRMSNEK